MTNVADKTTYLYAVEREGRIKLGVSVYPRKRGAA